MSHLQQLSIQGIRSFGPRDEDCQLIRFFSPLTLILGPNGTGKTTIIECLKYMTTGEMPPGGKKDGAFVHDPKIANDREVKAQIRLQFFDVQGQTCTATRSLSATQKLRKIETKSIESLITRRLPDGTKKSISNRCAEMDREMVSLLGVSRAVLDNVIFCHQEEANWPLSEGKALKQKFDDIFASTRYVKALESIRKTRLEQNSVISNYKTEIKYLKQNKEKCAQMEADLDDTETRRMSALESMERIVKELQPTEEKLNLLSTKANNIYELQTKVEKLKSESSQMEKTQTALRDNIKNEFRGSTDELKEALADFEARLRKQESNLKQCESELQKTDRKVDGVSQERSRLLLDQGKLQQEAERHRQNVKARDSLMEKLANQYELQGDYSVGVNNAQFDEFIGRLDEKAKACLQSANEKRARYEEMEGVAQCNVDKLRNQRTTLQTQEAMKVDTLKKNKIELKSINDDLSRVDASADRLTDIERDSRQTESEIKDLEQSVNVDGLRTEVAQLTGEREEFDAKLKRLDVEMNRMNRESGARTQLELFRKDKSAKEDHVRRLKAKHDDSIQYLFGEVTLAELRSKVDEYATRQAKLIRAGATKLQELQQQLTQVDTNRKNQMDLLAVKDKELKDYEEKIFSVCESQNFDDGLEKVQSKLRQIEDTKGYLKGTEHVYQKYRTQLDRDDPPCPLCHRPFDTLDEVEELVSELRSKLSLVPDKLETVGRDQDKFKRKYETMLQLKPIRSAMAVLIEKDLPNLKSKITSLKQEAERLGSQISEREEELETERADEGMCKLMQPDVATVDRYLSEMRDLDRKIAAQAVKLSGDNGDRSLQQVTTEREDVQMNLETIGRNVERKRSRISDHADALQRLKAHANELRAAQLRLEQDLQRRLQLEARRDALRAVNRDVDAEVQEAREQMKPIQNEIRSLIEEKDILTSEKEAKYEIDKKEFNSIKDNEKDVSRCQRETIAYLRSGREEELRRCEERQKRTDEAIESLESERDSLLKNISSINKDLTTQKVRERELEDNLQLRRRQTEIDEASRKVALLVERLGGLDVTNLNEERKHLISEQDELRRQKNVSAGRLHGFEEAIRKAKADLQHDIYRNSEKKYRDKMIDLRTTEMGVSDLEKYYKALDKTIMGYHSTKMAEINKIIQELWRNTYKGNDIETIEIRSDEDDSISGAAKARRVYHYRVVTIRNEVSLDMRGRCSAGQKVLASLIIRLALAETFCLNCGVLALDEPTTNLDRENIASLASALVEIIKSRSRQRNFQLIVITHDEDFVELLGRSEFVERFYKVRKNHNGLSELVRACVGDIQMK